MSSYSELYIGNYPVLSGRNGYYEDVVNLLFLEDDYVKEKRLLKLRNDLTWGESYKGEKGYFTFKGFQQNIKICKKRLEINGYCLRKAKKYFNESLKILKENQWFDKSIIENISFDVYLNEIRYIISNKITKKKSNNKTFRGYIINSNLILEEMPIIDGIYCILCALDDNEYLEYDLTDIIRGGWVFGDLKKQLQTDRILILTEGKTDTEFISQSIKILYPELAGLYHFVDYHTSKIEGSASSLVKIIKAFNGAQIEKRIIALFDFDAAAENELFNLKGIKLPWNIKIVKYPKIDLALKYPTIGPNGKKQMNINGKACSIELYLGIKILREKNRFIPIQWKAYQDKAKKYQGEIMNKNLIHERFRKKVKNFELEKFEKKEWANMDLLINNIFKCFECN